MKFIKLYSGFSFIIMIRNYSPSHYKALFLTVNWLQLLPCYWLQLLPLYFHMKSIVMTWKYLPTKNLVMSDRAVSISLLLQCWQLLVVLASTSASSPHHHIITEHHHTHITGEVCFFSYFMFIIAAIPLCYSWVNPYNRKFPCPGRNLVPQSFPYPGRNLVPQFPLPWTEPGTSEFPLSWTEPGTSASLALDWTWYLRVSLALDGTWYLSLPYPGRNLVPQLPLSWTEPGTSASLTLDATW